MRCHYPVLVGLAFDDRRRLKLAVDEAKRVSLQRSPHMPKAGWVTCKATSVVGRPCRNQAGPDGYCGVHSRAYHSDSTTP